MRVRLPDDFKRGHEKPHIARTHSLPWAELRPEQGRPDLCDRRKRVSRVALLLASL